MPPLEASNNQWQNASFLGGASEDTLLSTKSTKHNSKTLGSRGSSNNIHTNKYGTVMKTIKSNFSKMIKRSSFLQKKPSQERLQGIAYFDRSEIEIGDLLGEGGFSQIYEITGFQLSDAVSKCISSRNQQLRHEFQESAIDTTTGKPRFVLKHLRPQGWHDWRDYCLAAADLLGEASYLIRLNHPNIIQLRGLPKASWTAYEDGSHDGFFLILDRLSCTLQERIAEWRQQQQVTPAATEEQEADFSYDDDDSLNKSSDRLQQRKLQYSKQVASALQYLHQRSLVFRDLKPANIGFSAVRPDQVVLFDFGFCRQVPGDHLVCNMELYAMSCIGTKRYAAPEMLRQAIYNTKVDVHAWALTVWEMFTLTQPFSSYSESQFAKHVVVGNERPALTTTNSFKNGDKKQRHPTPMGSVPKCLHDTLIMAWHPAVEKRSDSTEVCRAIDKTINPRDEAMTSRRRQSTSFRLSLRSRRVQL